jgi:hypothetical protein
VCAVGAGDGRVHSADLLVVVCSAALYGKQNRKNSALRMLCVCYLCYEVQSTGLHSPCAESRSHVSPQHRGNSVPCQTV